MTDLRHGYTLADIHRIAGKATRTEWSQSASNYADRLDTAWHGVVEHLYTADDPPAERDLVWAGRSALQKETQKELSARGISRHYDYTEARNFGRYWDWFGRNIPSHEDRVIERAALGQIWPHLRPVDQEALLALAAHDHYDTAAAALGKKYNSFAIAVRRARLRFLELWHEGEEPSQPWARDRRIGRRADSEPRMGDIGRAGVNAVRRRQSRMARASARTGRTPQTPSAEASTYGGEAA
jgi:hypothetical protein